MAEISDEEYQQNGPPDTQVVRRPQDQGLVEGEEEVEIGELAQDDARGDGDAFRGGGGGSIVRQLQILQRAVVRVEGAHQGRKGLDDEKEDAIGGGQPEGRACHGG